MVEWFNVKPMIQFKLIFVKGLRSLGSCVFFFFFPFLVDEHLFIPDPLVEGFLY